MKIAVAVRVRPSSGPSTLLVDARLAGGRPDEVRVGTRAFRNWSSVVTGSDQQRAFDQLCTPLLRQLADGYAITFLAYGQTGSGKTHTIFGPPGSLTQESLAQAGGGVPPAWGLLPRLALELLRAGAGSTLHASAIEVYQDKAYDLLADRAPLTVGTKSAGRKVEGADHGAIVIGNHGGAAGACSSGVGGTAHAGSHPPGCRCGACWKAKEAEKAARRAKVEAIQAGRRAAPPPAAARAGGAGGDATTFATVGETLIKLETPEDVARLALTVEVTRTATAHNLNARSSRSHCLVHLHLTEKRGTSMVRRQLLFVDLAGSERILKSGVEGVAKSQAIVINGSLAALGKVIRALGDQAAHVPYRDSPLTMLLRGSLGGGKAITSVVTCVAAEEEHGVETCCTLEFGQRMAGVRQLNTAVAGAVDVGREAEAAAARLAAARAALRQLEVDGMGERFGPAATDSAVRSFHENCARVDDEEASCRRAKAALAEAKAADAPAEALRALEARVHAAAAEAANYRDIVMRQKTIKGFFIAPKATYVAKEAEVRALEAQLAQLGV